MYNKLPSGNDRGSLSSRSGEFKFMTGDAIGNTARSSVWSVPRSGVAGREAANAGGGEGGRWPMIAVLVVTNSTSRVTCHKQYKDS